MPMRVLVASAEVSPLASTGGLGGVAGSLPGALAGAGVDASVITPFYASTRDRGHEWLPRPLRTDMGEEFGVAVTELPGSGARAYLVARDELFDRPGIYGPDDSSAYPDNDERFAFLCRAIVAFVRRSRRRWDLVHCNDWQTGLVAAMLRGAPSPAVLTTIHNLGFKGLFPASRYHVTGLPPELLSIDGLEFHGRMSYLKAGLVFSDLLTTVSPTYAREILTPEYGEGMEGVLQGRRDRLVGILNGIDFDRWDPATDPHIASPYDSGCISGKHRCRLDLARTLGLEPRGSMIAGMVSRLTRQKGIDLVVSAAGRLIAGGVSLAVLGTGERRLMEALSELKAACPGRVGLALTYDERMARKVFAGSDALLMPSRFEPCGLAQMMAMRYGTVPVVRRTGGLADTVTDVMQGGVGFVFDGADPSELAGAVRRASRHHARRRMWPWLAKRCMRVDSSWRRSASRYREAYERALRLRREEAEIG